MQLPPTLLLRFNAEKTGSANCAATCHQILFSQVPLPLLEGVTLYGGVCDDPARGQVYLLALQAKNPSALDSLRARLESSEAFAAVSASPALQMMPGPLELSGTVCGGSLSEASSAAQEALDSLDGEEMYEKTPPAQEQPQNPPAPPAQTSPPPVTQRRARVRNAALAALIAGTILTAAWFLIPRLSPGSAGSANEGESLSQPQSQQSGEEGSTPGVQEGSTPGVQEGSPPGVQEGSPPGVQEGSTPGVQEGSPPGENNRAVSAEELERIEALVNDDILTLLEQQDTGDGLLVWMSRYASLELGTLELRDTLLYAGMSEEGRFPYGLYLPDVAGFEPPPEPLSARNRMPWLTRQMAAKPLWKRYELTCVADGERVLWVTADLIAALDEIEADLSAYFGD